MALLEPAAIGLPHWVATYLAELTARNYSPSTIRFRRAALARLRALVDQLGVGNLSVLSRATLRRYQAALSEHRQSNGNPLAWTTQAEELIAIKGFLRWCVRARLLRRSPDDVIVLPRRPRQLPRGVLSIAEVECVLAQPVISTALGLRDRALLETLNRPGIAGDSFP